MTLEVHILLIVMGCIGGLLVVATIVLALVCDSRSKDKFLTRYNSETPHPLASHFV